MSTGPEPTGDLVAVACVADASLILAAEWSRILIEYVFPLLKRLQQLHPSHQFRLAFVTYGAANTRPHPLLSKKYFAPLAQVAKQLREEDPSKLGIGQTGSGRGLSALEGLVAAIEMFDILMASANFNANHAPTQSPQKDTRSLVAHLLHIAASPPDNAQRPRHNTLHHLDSVNWDSIPVELRKRKINLSLIGLRKIPPFQELQSLVAGPGAQSPWFNVHAPHVVLLAGFPPPQKTGTKRLPDTLPSDQSPDPKRPKVSADPTSKTASPALPPARIPQNQRPQQLAGPQAPQPPSSTAPVPNPSPVQQPAQAPTSVPASASATSTPFAPPPSGPPSMPPANTEALDPAVAQARLAQMIEHVKVLDNEVTVLEAKLTASAQSGQTAAMDALQKERNLKAQVRDQIKILLMQHFQKARLAKDAQNAQASSAGLVVPNASAEAGSSTQPAHPPHAPSTSSERPMDPTPDEHKPAVPDAQVLAQFWQSRGGTIAAPNGGNLQAGPSQAQPRPNLTPEMMAQMQKLLEKKGIRPPSNGPSSQMPGSTSQEASVTPNATNVTPSITNNNSTWFGAFSGTFPGQASELQILVAGAFSTPMPPEIRTEIRTDLWPKKLALKFCKEPLKDGAELSSWLKGHQTRTRVMQFKPYPRAPDAALNEQRFQALIHAMVERRIFAYAGWQLPSGRFSYNVFIFPMSSSFAGAVFPDGLPDLPGRNTLEVPPQAGAAKPQPSFRGIPLPPTLIARMQGLGQAEQKQVLAQFLAHQQGQLRRQQLQRSQQAQAASGQAMNPLGMSIPPNPYGAAANIPTGMQANMNAPIANAGAYNAAGGTVNYEMLQSFMQRNADGSTSKGTTSGSMP